MNIIKIFEDFNTVNYITDLMNSLGFRLSKNDKTAHPHLFHNPDFKYEYGIIPSGTNVNVLNKDYEIVDTYTIDDFLAGLKKWGIDFIKTNHDNINKKLQEKKINKNYLKGSIDDKKRMKDEIKKHSKKSDDDSSAYGKWPADYEKGNTAGKKKETKKSKATKKFAKVFEAKSEDVAILLRTNEPFWIGAVNILDGYIEEVHTFETAKDNDFHHSMYFSIPILDRQKRDEEVLIFWFENGVPYNWEGNITYNIKKAILSQVELIKDVNESKSYETGLKNKLEKAKEKYPKLTLSILKQVYDRGMAAWKTGHRPGTTQNQWAMARVNSFLTGIGKVRKADKDLWDEVK